MKPIRCYNRVALKSCTTYLNEFTVRCCPPALCNNARKGLCQRRLICRLVNEMRQHKNLFQYQKSNSKSNNKKMQQLPSTIVTSSTHNSNYKNIMQSQLQKALTRRRAKRSKNEVEIMIMIILIRQCPRKRTKKQLLRSISNKYSHSSSHKMNKIN